MIRRAHCIRTRVSRPVQAGFSMLEFAIVLVVAGLISWAAFSGYETVTAQQEVERGRAEAQQLKSMLRAFALRHGRLPCPDSDAVADGYENLTAGVCTANNRLGWFPYVSLGLSMPTDKLLARYSVFRGASAATDLAVVDERTGDGVGSATFRDVSDLIVALNNGSTAPDAGRTHLTGDGGLAGAIDCAGNRASSAAYWLIVPLEDKNGDGNRFDAPHTPASVCAASPSAPLRFGSDDVVEAESPLQLAGWLRSNLP